MTDATRRGFLAGAAGTLVAARAAEAATPGGGVVQAKQEIVRRGRAIAADPQGRRLVVAHDQRTTIGIVSRRSRRSRLVDVGGQPLDVAVSPDGRRAAVVTAAWAKPGLAIVDLDAGRVRERVDVGPAPGAVEFSADGRRIVVTGGEQEGTVTIVDAAHGSVVAQRAIGAVPRGIAPVPGRAAAWIALEAQDRLVRVDLRDGRVRRTLRVARLPERISISPDGKRLLVGHGGMTEHVSEITLAGGRITRHRTGRHVSGVGWARGGKRVVVLGGAGQVLVIRAGGRRTRRGVGGAPRGLALAAGRAWTVDALDDAIRMVRP